MSRQPRANIRSHNYNFEQFKEYTAMYENARVKDEHDSKEFYKLVKYVAKKTEGGEIDPTNMIVRDFLKKYQLDQIQIPEEFKDVEPGDSFTVKRKAKANKRRVYTRTDKNLAEYDVWRCFDRGLIVPTGKEDAVCKLLIAPALLKKAFGFPDKTQIGFAGTGQYDFEDSNLDLFRLMDYKKTDLYHGLAREDSFYLTKDNMRKPEHKRNKKWPTIEEFWTSDEPQEFRLLASEQADWRKFKRWLRRHLSKVEGSDFDFDKDALEKNSDLDICLGDYDKKGVVNTEMAIFKWNNTIFMSADELKNTPEDKRA